MIVGYDRKALLHAVDRAKCVLDQGCVVRAGVLSGICDDKPVCKECPGEMHATGLQCEPAGLTCVFEPGCTAWTCQCTAKPGDVPRWVCRPNACRPR